METAQNLSLSKPNNFLRDLLIVLGTSGLFALSAWISIPLPFTPVPISLTCQLILLASVFLGKRGAYATFAYIGQGLIGLPVFANGGCSVAYLFGPTGGYLIGFAIASYVVGTLSEQMEEKSGIKSFALMLVGNALIYLFGLPHLALIVGGQNALKFGFYPFIITDLLKLMLATKALKSLKS